MEGNSKKDYLYAVISGLLLGISFPPFPLPYLAFVALVPFLIVINKKTRLNDINKLTYVTFFIFSLITLYWVGSWQPDADPFLLVSGTVLIVFNPLVFFIPSSLFHIAKNKLNLKYAIYLFPFFWVFYEYLYSLTDLRFPWLTLGHGQAYFNSFIQIADIIGSPGISLLIVLINVLILKSLFGKGKYSVKPLFVALLIIVLSIVYGQIKISSKQKGETIKVGLIQPDLNPWKKWEAGNLDKQLDLYMSLSQTAVDSGANLVVWPETALPVYLLSGNYEKYANRIKTFVDTNKISLVTGMPDVIFYKNEEDAPEDAKRNKYSKYLYTSYNGVLGFSCDNDKTQRYGKIKLVPFGEHVPFVEELPFLGDFIRWNVGISSWNIGKRKLNFELKSKDKEFKITPVICIESIYPAFVADFVNKESNLIVVVTNDSWYGDSSGPYQHRDFARLRAVENRRYVVRAANGGISCIIDEYGNIVKKSSMYTRDVVVGDVVLNKDKSFYTEHPAIVFHISSLVSVLVIISGLILSIGKFNLNDKD